MKKTWLLVFALSLSSLALVGCNNKCDCECDNLENEPTVDENVVDENIVDEPVVDEDAVLNQRIEYCNEHWGTHSLIHSPTAVYGECAFPSGVICEDTILWTDECDYSPNLESIDTEEKRLAGCEENVQWRVKDFVEGSENISTQWEDESEGWASFVRNWIVKYTKDWANYTMSVECVADFVDGSLWVTYGDPVVSE